MYFCDVDDIHTVHKSMWNERPHLWPSPQPTKIVLSNQASLQETGLPTQEAQEGGLETAIQAAFLPERTKWLFWQLLTQEIAELSSQSAE